MWAQTSKATLFQDMESEAWSKIPHKASKAEDKAHFDDADHLLLCILLFLFMLSTLFAFKFMYSEW